MKLSKIIKTFYKIERRRKAWLETHPDFSVSDYLDDGIEVPKIEINIQERLRKQEDATRAKVVKLVDRFIKQQTVHIADEKHITDLHDIAVIILDVVNHDFMKVSNEYLEEIINQLKDAYAQKRDAANVDAVELRRLLHEFDQKVLVLRNISRVIVKGFSEDMLEDSVDFKQHAILKIKQNTSLPLVLQAGSK